MPAEPDAMVVPSPDAAPEPDLSGELFKPDEVLEISIELDEAHWDILRYQARTHYDVFAGVDCQADVFPNPFTYFPATVTVNGDRIENVGVRKKGFFGSVNPVKPSLKLNLDHYVSGQKYSSVEDITLNNGRQPSFGGGLFEHLQMTQCLGYKLCRDMGLPASRCNFAHVTVNGRDMGLYAHVERIREPMLSYHFENGAGYLYEGNLSDFREGWMGTFEQKSHRSTPNPAPLLAAKAALELVDDGEFATAIEAAVDVDQHARFWAMEILIGHSDSYDFNTNNFWVYQDPGTGKLNFMPWGMDWTFRGQGSLARTVPAGAALSRRMYTTPAMQTRYLAALQDILANGWVEADIIAEVDRMEALLDPYVVDDPETVADESAPFHNQAQAIRNFVTNRRATAEALIADKPVPASPLLPDFCSEQKGTFAASFTATWQAPGGAFGNGSTASASGVRNGEALAINAAGALAQPSANELYPILLRVRVRLADNTTFLNFDVFVSESAAQEGVDIPIDWVSAQSRWTAFLGLADGTIRFNTLNMTPGGEVSGTLSLSLYEF
jgi:hypothetical protein